MNVSTLFTLLKQSFRGWQQDQAGVWCAALAYYTVFSIGPLLLVILSIVGIFFGTQHSQKQIADQLQNVVGAGGAQFVTSVIASAHKQTHTLLATVIGIITLLLSALGIFGHLQLMMNAIWGVRQKPGLSIMRLVKVRISNFLLVVVAALLLLVSLLATTATAGLQTYVRFILPFSSVFIESLDILISLFITSCLFALIFKYIPDVQLKLRDVWAGALLTAILFTLGKTLIGLYIGHIAVGSEYGAAGSLIAFLLWTFYSSNILFLGSEFTKAYTSHRESEVIPSQHAMFSKPVEKVKKATGSIIAEAAAGFVAGAVNEAVKEVHSATDPKKLKKKRRSRK